MVTLAGAIAAQPFVDRLAALNNAVTALQAAINSSSVISQIMLQVSSSGQPATLIGIAYNFNAADSTAIFFDIKNIISNDINIENNGLGAIT